MKKKLLCLVTLISLSGCYQSRMVDDMLAMKQEETEKIDEGFTVTPDVIGDNTIAGNQNAYLQGSFNELLEILDEQFNQDDTYITISKEALVDMYSLSDDFASDAISFLSSEENNYNCIYLFNDISDEQQLQNMFEEVYGAIEATYSEADLNEIPYQNIELENLEGFAVGDKEFITSVCEIVETYIIGEITNE